MSSRKDDGTINNIVNYTSRDYDSILEGFKEIVPSLTDLWSPEAEADPGEAGPVEVPKEA